MDTMKKALDLLQETEHSLRRLLEEALAAGDYRSLSAIAQWADLMRDITGGPRSVTARAPKAVQADRKNRPQPRGTNSKKYPIFQRAEDQLIKIGWSKTKKAEYEQRANRTVVDVLVDAFTANSDGNPITMEQILPLFEDERDHAEIPNYQAYLALRWLRSIGVMKKHGRNSYSMSVADPEGIIFEEWKKLPRRN